MQAEEIEECPKNKSISNDFNEEVNNCAITSEDDNNHCMFELIEEEKCLMEKKEGMSECNEECSEKMY